MKIGFSFAERCEEKQADSPELPASSRRVGRPSGTGLKPRIGPEHCRRPRRDESRAEGFWRSAAMGFGVGHPAQHLYSFFQWLWLIWKRT